MKNKLLLSKKGVEVLGLLGIVFVVLKLCNVIDWSWWYVTAPFWGQTVLGIMTLIIVLLGRANRR